MLYINIGKKYSFDLIKRFIQDKFTDKTDKIEKREVEKKEPIIPFFGVQIPIWRACFYCIMNLVIFFGVYFLDKRPLVIKIIFNNNFLTIIYAIPSLTFITVLLPIIFEKLIKKSDELYMHYFHKSIKI